MARIQTYPLDGDLDPGDMLVGTDGTPGADMNKTKNFTLGDLRNYILAGGLNYKVFTGLMTQQGADSPASANYGNQIALIIGQTYHIDDVSGGADFTNVGASSNTVGLYFIATGTTPAHWGTGSLSYNEGTATVKVLENNIGNIWFSYSGDAAVAINSNGLFNPDKTMSIVALNTEVAGPDPTLYSAKTISDSFIVVEWYIPTSDTLGTPPTDTPIEIRVYN